MKGMKREYQKPEVEVVELVTEAVTNQDSFEGETDVESSMFG